LVGDIQVTALDGDIQATDGDTQVMVGDTQDTVGDIQATDGDTQVTVGDTQDTGTGMVQITPTTTAEEVHLMVDRTTITLETILILEMEQQVETTLILETV
jgi:hypothetical protein